MTATTMQRQAESATRPQGRTVGHRLDRAPARRTLLRAALRRLLLAANGTPEGFDAGQAQRMHDAMVATWRNDPRVIADGAAGHVDWTQGATGARR